MVDIILWSRQESNLHLMFRKHPFPLCRITTEIKITHLLHTFATHFLFLPNLHFLKLNLVLHFSKTDILKKVVPLGNTYTNFRGILTVFRSKITQKCVVSV